MKKRSWYLLLTVFLLTVILNLLAWNSTAFCDWYVLTVYPVWITIFGHFSSLFPFSLGEFLIAVGLVWLAITILFSLLSGILWIINRKKERTLKIIRICKMNYKVLGMTATFAFLIQTLNCFILYHTSTFEQKYMLPVKEEYTLEELANLRDYVVEEVNELSKLVERNEEGNIIYEGSMEAVAIQSMEGLGSTYAQLEGYYPTPKKMAASKFVSQQHMQGYFFPFSMEANYNDVMHILRKPSTMCHELAHAKGFIYEDEANLIGYLACINSEDMVFRYSGYLSVLNYIDNDYYNSVHKNKEIYNTHVKISPQVKRDNTFLTQEAWMSVEKKAIIKTETVSKVTDKAISASLVANGIEEGSLSYRKVVGLLLDYYGGMYGNELEKEYLVQGE